LIYFREATKILKQLLEQAQEKALAAKASMKNKT
jgi:hypothetical protein